MTKLPMPGAVKTSQKKWLEKWGTFLAILVINVAIVLMLGTMVIFPGIFMRVDEPTHFAKVTPPEAPKIKPPPKSGGAGAKSNLDPSVVVQPPPVAPPPIVVTTAAVPSTFASSTMPQISSIPLPQLTQPQGSSQSNQQSSNAGNAMNLGNALFGVPDSDGVPMMTGTLYDLKQTTDRKPTGLEPSTTYHKEIRNFVTHNWDQSILDKYYKFSKSLFTPQIYIPDIQAALGPKQFGAENEVQPRMWIAYYKATVIPNDDGNFQFYGSADDIIVVRVNGVTVMDGCLNSVSTLRQKDFKFDLLDETQHMWGSLKQGIPFHVNAGEPVNLDVIIGEEPGGWFNAVLLLGKVGVKYDVGPNGMPKIPVFQVAPCNVPNKGERLDAGPPIVWPAQAAAAQ